jgi:hypothetical protein
MLAAFGKAPTTATYPSIDTNPDVLEEAKSMANK